VVTGVAAGTATVTVITEDGGKEDTCTATVTAGQQPATTVDVAGTVGNRDTPDARATLWTGGVPQQLSSTTSSAYSVYVSGGNVYVAGMGSDTSKALYWRNGIATELGPNRGMAIAICASGSTAYAAGSMLTADAPNATQPATLWTNGNAQFANSDLRYGFFNGLFLTSGGALYGAGDVTNRSQIEKDQGQQDDLKGRAFLLRNNNVEAISDKASWGSSVYVSGSDVYVALTEWTAASGDNGSSTRAMLWKNGSATQLSNGTSNAASVFVVAQ
jgi:hypothetical protein